MSIKNIAILDDDEYIRSVIEKYILGESEYNTCVYSTGAELLEGLKTKKIDLILLDIEMPEMDGVQTYDKLRSAGFKDVPVVFLTGKEDRSTVLRCIGKGADGYLIKPVAKDILLEKIKEVFSKYIEYKSDSTILMIDDDVEFLKIAKVKLSKYHKVLTVNSGKTALDYLTSHKVDLIILDYYMPLYDGANILNILRHRESTRDIPVIMVSSLQSDKIVTACQKNQPDGILVKPVDMEELLSTIHDRLARE